MLLLVVADRQQAGAAAGGGLQGPGKGGRPDQGTNPLGVLTLDAHRVELQAIGQGQRPALEFAEQQGGLSLPRPRHHHPQGRDGQELFDLQPQQQPPRRGPLLDLRERQPFSHRYQRSTKQTASKGKGP